MTETIWQMLGIKQPNPEDAVMHHIANIGDLDVESNAWVTNLKCDDEIIMSIARKDGGLAELAAALASQVIE